MRERLQNSTTHPITFLMVSSSDHITPVNDTFSPTVGISKDGGASWITPSGAITALSISAPTYPGGVFTGASSTGGFLAQSTTYFYKVSATNPVGETVPGTEQSYTVPASGTATNQITINWNAVTGATGYKIYRSTTSGNELLLATVGNVTSYADTTNTTPSGSPLAAGTTAGGWFAIAANATDRNTLGSLIIHASGSGADPTDAQYTIVGYDPFNSANLALTALPSANPAASGGFPTVGTGSGQLNPDGAGNVTIKPASIDTATLTTALLEIVGPYAISSATTTGLVTADTYVVMGIYNGSRYFKSTTLGTPVYAWYNNSGYTLSATLGTNGSAYFTTGAGQGINGTWTAQGTAGGTPVFTPHGNAILAAFQPEQPLTFNGTNLDVNIVQIAGSAVSATTAQLGVNVVNYGNHAVTLDANNLPSVNAADWNGHVVATPNVAGVPIIDLGYTKGTISVGQAGSVGIDWAQVANPTATVTLSTTTVLNATQWGGQAPPTRVSSLSINTTGQVGLDFNNINEATAPTTLTNITVPNVTTTASVTNPVTAGTVTDKAGYQLSTTGLPLISGNIVSGASAAGFVGSSNLSGVDGSYVDQYLAFTSGALQGQARIIASYTGSTKAIVFNTPFNSSPANGDTFDIQGSTR